MQAGSPQASTTRMTGTTMNKFLLLGTAAMAIAVSGLALPGRADAQEANAGKSAGSFMVRARVIGVLPENSGSSTSVGGHVGATNAVTPELDFSYFFTPNIAADLILATTQHTISAKDLPGKVNVGKTWVLPPTVTLQYHFMPKERFSPYVGAGLNATFFYSEKASAPFTSLSLTPALGFALQAGFDYNISGNWYANVDVKQIFLHTKAKISGGAVTAKTWLNPLVVGAGLGYKF